MSKYLARLNEMYNDGAIDKYSTYSELWDMIDDLEERFQVEKIEDPDDYEGCVSNKEKDELEFMQAAMYVGLRRGNDCFCANGGHIGCPERSSWCKYAKRDEIELLSNLKETQRALAVELSRNKVEEQKV